MAKKFKNVSTRERNALKLVFEQESRQQEGYKPKYVIEAVSIPEDQDYADTVKQLEAPGFKRVWFSAFHKGHRHVSRIQEEGVLAKGAWVNSDVDIATNFIKGSKVSAKRGDIGYIAVVRASVVPANNSSAYTHHLLNEDAQIICAIKVLIG